MRHPLNLDAIAALLLLLSVRNFACAFILPSQRQSAIIMPPVAAAAASGGERTRASSSGSNPHMRHGPHFEADDNNAFVTDSEGAIVDGDDDNDSNVSGLPTDLFSRFGEKNCVFQHL